MNFNVYDFDHTIYDGDCTVDFYLFCMKKKRQQFYIYHSKCMDLHSIY